MSGELSILNESLSGFDATMKELKADKRIKEITKHLKDGSGDMKALEEELLSVFTRTHGELIDSYNELLRVVERETDIDSIMFFKPDVFLKSKEMLDGAKQTAKDPAFGARFMGIHGSEDDNEKFDMYVAKTNEVKDFFTFWNKVVNVLLKAKENSGANKINIPQFDSPITDGNDERRVTRYLEAIKVLKQADNGSDQIYGPEFKNAVEDLSRAFSIGEDFQKDKAREETDGEFGRQGPDFGFPSLATVGSPIKKLTKAVTTHPQYVMQIKSMLYFFHSWVPVKELIARVKPTVIKGKRPSQKQIEKKANSFENMRAKLIGNNESRVVELLTQMGDKSRDDLELMYRLTKSQEVEEVFGKYDEYKNAFEKKDGRSRKFIEAFHRAVNAMGEFFDYEWEQLSARSKLKTLEISKSIKLKIKAFAKTQADYVIENFVQKNVVKIALIIDEKGNLSEIKSLSLHTDKSTIVGEIRCNFADSSAFTVRNKIVINNRYSWQKGESTYFAQYPTTFHDVIFTDGTKQKMVPEAIMKSSFSKMK